MSSVRMQNFVIRLKSKNFEIRKRAAQDLNLYVIFLDVVLVVYKFVQHVICV